jgi:hypothetical protein
MFLILRKLIDSSRGQRGQVLVMAVGVLIMSLGAIMISVDVAWWLRDKRDAQNDTDAIALAAVQDLPDRLAAELSGDDWAVANGVDPFTDMGQPACTDGQLAGSLNADGFYRYCFIDQNSDGTDDMVRVKISRPSISFIADAFGVGSPTLNPSAAAATVYVSGACVMPWGIVGENDDPADHFGLDPEALYVFQATDDFAGGGSSPGNFGALRMYGQGGNVYRDAIEGICEPRQGACTTDPMVFVDGTLVGCETEPGGMPGPTVLGLNTRFPDSPSPGACDAVTIAEALDRVDPGSSTYCPERLVPVAIINEFPPGGAGDIVVYGIANFYLAGWAGPPATCFIVDGVEKCGFVWGYLITNAPASTAETVFTRDFIPFAPTGSALVE